MQPVVYELGKISGTLHQADSGELHLKPGQELTVQASKDDLDEKWADPDPGKREFAFMCCFHDIRSSVADPSSSSSLKLSYGSFGSRSSYL